MNYWCYSAEGANDDTKGTFELCFDDNKTLKFKEIWILRNFITSLKNLAVIKNSNACKRQLIGHTLSQGQEPCKKTN